MGIDGRPQIAPLPCAVAVFERIFVAGLSAPLARRGWRRAQDGLSRGHRVRPLSAPGGGALAAKPLRCPEGKNTPA